MSYAEALSTLLEMFPTMPRDTIEVVLKSHGGNLQTATEALLLASGEDQAQTSTSTGASPAAQVWRDEELARAMQAQLDAETGRVGSASWLPDETREDHGNGGGPSSSSQWDYGAEEAFKEWRDMAASVGQTLSEGFTAVTETLSTWLSAPFEEDEEEDLGRRRPGSSRGAADEGVARDRTAVVTAGDAASQAPLHRRAQLRESPSPHTPAAGAIGSSHTDIWDSDDGKKDK